MKGNSNREESPDDEIPKVPIKSVPKRRDEIPKVLVKKYARRRPVVRRVTKKKRKRAKKGKRSR